MRLQNIVDEVKRIGISLVPFSMMMVDKNKKIDKLYSKNSDTENVSNITVAYQLFNGLASIALTCGIVATMIGYAYISIENKTLDYVKWPEIEQQKDEKQIEQRKVFESNVLNKSFSYFDSNLDGLISKKEFEKGIESTPKTKLPYLGEDFYDYLNYKLNLGYERVVLPKVALKKK